ncbi:MAG: ATP-binding protein, partial [Candidatus Sulfotelmatobacter sp.]
MKITSKQIDFWRSAPNETENLEFKEAKNQFDTDKLLEYCVAISNECGGHLILGVKNNHPREVVGTSAFQNPNKIAEKLLQSLKFRVDIHEVAHPSGRVLVFEIPSRPKGTPREINGQYFMRCGESLVAMTPDQLRKIFDEGKPGWLEEQAAENLTIAKVISLLNTQKFFELINLPYPTDQFGVVERLESERLIDLIGDRYSIRNMGAILLAKNLDKFHDLALRAPRVVVYTGKSKTATKLDQPGTMGYAVGFSGLVGFVMSHIPQNEIIKNALRKEMKLVPEIVIREILANAIIHQDFSTTGARITVEIYSNRVDISNPGVPIIAEERFIDCYKSRNERLADLMRRMGICEEKGSGIDKVVMTAEVCQLPAPSFTKDGIRTQVTIFGPMEIDAMDRGDRIRACYQHCCLKYVMSERMTNQSLRTRFALPEAKSTIVSQAIAATVDEGKVKLDEKVGNSRRFARYVPY